MIHAALQPIEDLHQPVVRVQGNQRRPHIIAHFEPGILRGVQHPVVVRLNSVKIIVVILARFPITIIG